MSRVRLFCLATSVLVALLAVAAPASGASPLRLLVVTGGHDYPTSFYTLFEDADFVWDHETTSEEAYRRDIRERYDVLVMYDMPKTLSAPARANLQAFAESGKAIVVLHHAICSNNDWDWYRDLLGARYLLASQAGKPPSTYQHDVHIPVAIAKQAGGPHPITQGVVMPEIFDETYKGMWFSPDVKVLLTTTHPLSDPALAWISPYTRSRVVVIQLGHSSEAHRHAGYRRLVKNAVLWTAGRLRD
jgi:type 1 glutamine amidotransferase